MNQPLPAGKVTSDNHSVTSVVGNFFAILTAASMVGCSQRADLQLPLETIAALAEKCKGDPSLGVCGYDNGGQIELRVVTKWAPGKTLPTDEFLRNEFESPVHLLSTTGNLTFTSVIPPKDEITMSGNPTQIVFSLSNQTAQTEVRYVRQLFDGANFIESSKSNAIPVRVTGFFRGSQKLPSGEIENQFYLNATTIEVIDSGQKAY